MKLISLFLFFTLSMASCGNNIPFNHEVYLVRPVNIQVEALSGRKFHIRYFVQNQELSFDGYNLYISRSPIADGEIYSSLTPLSLDGGLPTFRHHPKEFNPNESKSATLNHYVDTVTKFEPTVRYYFRMTAHARETASGVESQPSKQVTSVALP